jgi:hypothetical protein
MSKDILNCEDNNMEVNVPVCACTAEASIVVVEIFEFATR